MDMKKFNISIWGYGAEVTIGTLTNDQIDIIKSEITEDYTLEDIIWDEKLGNSFYELDDVYHNWGVGDKFNVSVSDESGQEVYQFDDELLFSESEIFSYNDKWVNSTEPMIVCVSGEKGVFFESTIEDDQFDISKLKIEVDTEVGIDGYFYGDMISGVFYSGEELDNIGGSTDGKFFEVGTNIDFNSK